MDNNEKKYVLNIYNTLTGCVEPVEVSEEVYWAYRNSHREEENISRRERYHCWSLDSIMFEGGEYSVKDFAITMLENEDETKQQMRIQNAFSYLTKAQQRRLIMLASGKTMREIARFEKKDIKTIFESIESARKRFLSIFLETP